MVRPVDTADEQTCVVITRSGAFRRGYALQKRSESM